MFSPVLPRWTLLWPILYQECCQWSTGATRAWGLANLVEEHVSLQRQSCKFGVWDQCRKLRLSDAAGSWGELSQMELPETQTWTSESTLCSCCSPEELLLALPPLGISPTHVRLHAGPPGSSPSGRSSLRLIRTKLLHFSL
ncbi:hypothetical protein KIL84_022583 [Mauremys mutica]|uniref:Uncharacterized protein n=1 Tax=Mauremys mutica TaxID=74926 RepID=A0A9D3WLP6_9SAUR|nr:hypothetical protein KIL84_022583 [Mauremys mutica]